MTTYFGFTTDELRAVPETACSGGAEKLWRAWQGLISKEQEAVIEEFDAEKKASGNGPQDFEAVAKDPQKWAATRSSWQDRKEAALGRLEKLRETPSPLWRVVSGIEGNELALAPGERARGIRKLLKSVERMARTELRAEEQLRGGDWRKNPAPSADEEIEDRRCFAWEPLRTICLYLGIARTKLGTYALELWGLTSTQLVDRLKCETVREKMRGDMQKFVQDFVKNYDGEGDAVELAWKAFRASRGGTAYRTSLAARFGFSSYAKYSRACLMCYGCEPSELERTVLEEVVLEILTEPTVGLGTEHRAEVERDGVRGLEGEIQSTTDELPAELVADGDTKSQS